MINVTRSFMPPIEEYKRYIEEIWKNRYLTNDGPLLKELEQKLSYYMNINFINLVTNGTIALELAIKALDINEGEIITTPFSFVATTTSIIWERCKPIFVDIDKDTLNIDVNKIEKAITSKTKAILAVHVFGYPCKVERIEEIAKKYNIKVIYDGAHAFGCKYKGKSLLAYGDISTCSFHATKIFHTIEGGACITNDREISNKISALKKFGDNGNGYEYVGTNAKMTEFNAAMGLANLKYINDIILERKNISEKYDKFLKGKVKTMEKVVGLEYNYIYYPIVLKDEKQTLEIIRNLNNEQINPRRYFYPSLNTLKFIENKQKCPISEDISNRILCLPLYNGLKDEEIEKISRIILEKIKD